MEKFAIDLDKVLDDFEFNEDCAEQIASVATSAINTSTVTKHTIECVPPNMCNYLPVKHEKIERAVDTIPSSEEHGDAQQLDNDCKYPLVGKCIVSDTFPRKEESVSSSKDPINCIYMHDCVSNDKSGQELCVRPHHSDQMSSMIYNDISHNLLQKQNEHNNPKDKNRYDKKLNQPNIKPSISNVFNSLNEYINAPTGSLDYIDPVLHKTDNLHRNSLEDTAEKSFYLDRDVATKEYPIPKQKRIMDMVDTNNLDYKNILPAEADAVIKTETGDEQGSTVQSISSESSTVVCSKENNSRGIIHASDTKDQHDNTVNRELSNNEVELGKKMSIINDGVFESVSKNIADEPKPLQSGHYDPIYKCPFDENKESTTGSIIVSDTSKINNEGHNEDIEISKECSIVTNARISDMIHATDNFSEEELNQYLLELEEEARSKTKEDISHGNSSSLTAHNELIDSKTKIVNQYHRDDEDINEAPIFERIMIGELPEISVEDYQEKARKLPTIDYSTNVCNENIIHSSIGTRNLHEPNDNIKDLNEKSNQLKDVQADELYKTIKDADIIKTTSRETVTHENNLQPSPCVVVNEKVALKFENVGERYNHNVNIKQRLQQNLSMDTKSQDNNENVEDSLENKEDYDARIRYDITANNKENVFILHDNKAHNSNKNYKTEFMPKMAADACTISSTNENSQETEKPIRPQTLDIATTHNKNDIAECSSVTPGEPEHSEIGGVVDEDRGASSDVSDNSLLECNTVLGKQPPFWIPDSDAPSCMLCDVRFNVLKRRHHCRACGKVLCHKCCSMKFRLEYQGNIDSRVCIPCYHLLTKAGSEQGITDWPTGYSSYAACSDINSPQGRQPNPNNPMEYCSTIPPLQQLAGGLPPPPTVMVPVGVLKREGSKHRTEGSKSVMFSDGIRPGCDLTELDTCWDLKPPYRKQGNKRIFISGCTLTDATTRRQSQPPLDNVTDSYIPHDPSLLPPTVAIHKGQITYHATMDESALYKTLRNECEAPVMFAINRNLYAYVKITNLNCCVNKICWNVTSRGLACVGQDEVILLVEILPDETRIPKDLLIYINQLYLEAIKGNTMTELGFSVYQGSNLLGSREHTGFLFIRQTLQCLQKIVLPPAPFLVGLLVHRWETPWAKVFPLRLLLRLGAEYRYYPCPLVSVRFRDALYFEIGHTVMKVLADFRNFGYTLPGVIKGLHNSNDHVLAYASNFSISADSHLVCIQTNTGDESNYQTQAINIHNKPRTVTGASFIVINGALKSSMGLSAKSSIVEDGLMVEIMPEKMEALKAALKNMQDFSIGCGRQGASEPDETVNIKWVDNDVLFNLSVKSPIDGQLMDGIPSIRVHNGTDYKGAIRFIRWTEVFIIKSDDHSSGVSDPVDINKLSGNIAKATCAALVKLLDLLATAGLTKLGVRATIHPDNVGYEAGSEGTKLPPIYMNSLDNELIQVLHKAAQSSQDAHTVLELIFYVLDD